MVKKVFQVPNMRCTGCVILLEDIEDELSGIKSITASYHKQQMEVEYDAAQVTLEQIIEAAKRRGYPITPV